MKKLLIIFALLFSAAPLLTEVKAQAGESELPDWGFDYGILWEQWDDRDRDILGGGDAAIGNGTIEPVPPATPVCTLTVMTYNVWYNEFFFDSNRHAEVISRVKPDVVGLQEVMKESNFDNLKTRTGMKGSMFKTETPRVWWAWDFEWYWTGFALTPAYVADYGLGILWNQSTVGTPVITAKQMPEEFERHVAFMVAEFADFCFITTHYTTSKVDTDEDDEYRRLTTIEILNDPTVKRCKSTGKPIYITGDFNSSLTDGVIDIFQEKENGFKVLNPNAPTYPTFKKDSEGNYLDPTNWGDLIIEYNKNNPEHKTIKQGIPEFLLEKGYENLRVASDHFPYYVIVKLKNN